MMLDFVEAYGEPHNPSFEYEVDILAAEDKFAPSMTNVNAFLGIAITEYANKEYREKLRYFKDDDEGWLLLEKLEKRFSFLGKDSAKLFVLECSTAAKRLGYIQLRIKNEKLYWRVDEKCTDIRIYKSRWERSE